MEKKPINPMHSSPRCQAKSKRSGVRCGAPAVRGKRVCRMHGAKGGAPKGAAHGRYIHGAYAGDFLESIKDARESQRLIKSMFDCLEC